MLTLEHKNYLLSRGYTEADLELEGVQSVEAGINLIEGTSFETRNPCIGWPCKAMSGQSIGIQTRYQDGEYRWFPAEKAVHLPTMYGSEEDHQLFFDSGKVILTEGVFDRIAMKRMVPGYACYARLTRGVGKLLLVLMRRYATQIFLGFDMDGPGREATEFALFNLKDSIETHEIKYAAKDPSKLLERLGLRKATEIIRPQVENVL